jgi:DNA-binding CsgD family transcriptional regulator
MLEPLSRGDLLRAFDLATLCLYAKGPTDLESVVTGLADIVPFEKAALCAMRPSPGGPSLVHFVNHSYGADWAALYTGGGFAAVDPVLAHGQTTRGAFRWSDALLHQAHQATSRFLEAAREFDLVDGVSYSCASSPSEVQTVLSLSKLGTADERALGVLEAIGPHLHEAYRRVLKAGPDAPPASALTRREIEILGWTQQGKTYWEVGCILGISQRTVKYHFGRIKEKLDVVSASHAVAKAMRIGILS